MAWKEQRRHSRRPRVPRALGKALESIMHLVGPTSLAPQCQMRFARAVGRRGAMAWKEQLRPLEDLGSTSAWECA